MNTNASSGPPLPGARRSSFRQFFLGLGVGLLLLTGYFYLRAAELPVPILIIVGGGGVLFLLIGAVWPAPKPLTAVERQNRAVQADEDVLRSSPGSHQRGWENRGGTLNLTSARLVFFAHGMNMHNADVVIPLADIVRVERARTLGIIPNAFRIITTDGTRHQFTVFTPKSWITAIEEARA